MLPSTVGPRGADALLASQRLDRRPNMQDLVRQAQPVGPSGSQSAAELSSLAERLGRWRHWISTCLVVLLQLLRNVTLSLLCATLALWCCASGNVLSRRAVGQQQFVEFLSACVFWCGAFLASIIVSVQSSLLMTKSFIAFPERPIGFRSALWRVLRATFHMAVGFLAALVATVVVLDELTDGRARGVHLEYYASSVVGVCFISAVWIKTRRIYFDETVQGFERRQLQQARRLVAPDGAVPLQRLSSPRRRWWRQFVRIAVRAAPSAVSMAFAGLYVQTTSRRVLRTQQDLWLFGAASLAVKLVVQECIKTLMLRRHEDDIRTMFLAVGLPTVLIDTQIRVMLQLVQGASFSTEGAVAMALIEIVMRAAKVALLRLQLRRRERLVRRKVNDLRVVAARIQVSARSRRKSSRSTQSTRVDVLNELQQWRQRSFRFHAAEVYADMGAEYIAIGCSTMILVVYGNHPRFELWQRDTHPAEAPSLGHHLSRALVQAVVELAVDGVASLLEVAQGIDFHELRRHSAYIAVTFVGIGVMNVHVTTVMFMKTH
ncbi:hypothetical protein ATCC90586_003349 [Pythium insidiosum]|nr:hypothetical protein ATCC90586_003349 [Pythium insidiosum]